MASLWPRLPVAAQDASGADAPAAAAEPATAPGAAEAAAGGDEENAARARELFAAGVRLVGEHEFGEAEARFRSALALRDAPAIRYNLASVLHERGRYPEADALARSAAADETASADIREHSTALVAQIAEGAGFVRLDVIGPADATVAADGYLLPDASAEFPISPGEHVLVSTSAGVERSRETITIAVGEHRVVPIDASLPEGAVDEGEGEDGGAEDSGPPPPLMEEPALWIGVGAGVLVVTTAIIVGVVVASSGPEAPVSGNFAPGVIQW